jgi:hypothetical protein
MTMKAMWLPGLMTAVAAKTAAVLVVSREVATAIKTTPTDNEADVEAATNHRGGKGSGYNEGGALVQRRRWQLHLVLTAPTALVLSLLMSMELAREHCCGGRGRSRVGASGVVELVPQGPEKKMAICLIKQSMNPNKFHGAPPSPFPSERRSRLPIAILYQVNWSTK